MTDLATEWIAAWNAVDGVRLRALYAPDGTYEDVPSGMTADGDAITEFAAGFAGMVSGLTWTRAGDVDAAGGTALVWTFSGANAGLVPGDEAAGRPVEVRGCTVFQLDAAGLIRRSADYYDFATILRQCGALPDDESGGA